MCLFLFFCIASFMLSKFFFLVYHLNSLVSFTICFVVIFLVPTSGIIIDILIESSVVWIFISLISILYKNFAPVQLYFLFLPLHLLLVTQITSLYIIGHLHSHIFCFMPQSLKSYNFYLFIDILYVVKHFAYFFL